MDVFPAFALPITRTRTRNWKSASRRRLCCVCIGTTEYGKASVVDRLSHPRSIVRTVFKLHTNRSRSSQLPYCTNPGVNPPCLGASCRLVYLYCISRLSFSVQPSPIKPLVVCPHVTTTYTAFVLMPLLRKTFSKVARSGRARNTFCISTERGKLI